MNNERIKELLKQSQVLKEYKEFGAVRTEVDQEKFAELIVEAICYDIMNLHGCDPERVQMAARKFGVTV